jgi:hypothetical protein
LEGGVLRHFVKKFCVFGMLCACGGTPRRTIDQPFRSIQEQEQRIAEGNAALDGERNCQRARAASEEQVCAASKTLCQLAEPLADKDAQARCLHGADACRSARERAEQQCATTPAKHDG